MRYSTPQCYRSRVVTTPTTFKWMLWASTQGTSSLHDEFIAGEFRVRLMGNILELTFEGSGVCSPESARSLAESYVETLSRLIVAPLSLISEADFLARTAPPFGGRTADSSARWQDRDRARRAVREARNELLQAADSWLRRCYDYLQNAVEHRINPSPSGERTAYHDVYMAMEVLIERFGSDKAAVAALGQSVKDAKRLANSERHIKKKKGPTPPPPGDPIALATQAIRAYERHLIGRDAIVSAPSRAPQRDSPAASP